MTFGDPRLKIPLETSRPTSPESKVPLLRVVKIPYSQAAIVKGTFLQEVTFSYSMIYRQKRTGYAKVFKAYWQIISYMEHKTENKIRQIIEVDNLIAKQNRINRGFGIHIVRELLERIITRPKGHFCQSGFVRVTRADKTVKVNVTKTWRFNIKDLEKYAEEKTLRK